MKYTTLIFLLLSFGNMYCQELSQDSLVKQYFTTEEITQLRALTTDFEEQINRITNTEGKSSYQNYLKMDSLYVEGELDYESYRIPSRIAKRIVNSLDSALFKKIFYYVYGKEGLNSNTPGRKYRYVSPRADSPYADMGLKVGANNKFWKFYFEDLTRMGGLSPSTLATLPKVASRHIDLDSERDRLFVALHYLASMSPKMDI